MATVGLGAGNNFDAVNAHIAHMRGVKKAVHDEGRGIQKRAEALFRAHNNPGGHEIVGERQDTDYIVSLVDTTGDGDPLAVEYGREGFTRKSDGAFIGPMAGLHILGRAGGL